ncbi:hypothetical protein NKG05_27730 [Oerskovia sp. M15]
MLDAVGPWTPSRSSVRRPRRTQRTCSPRTAAGGTSTRRSSARRGPGPGGWLRAVRQGQARLARGLDVACPVLVAHSASSGPDDLTNPCSTSRTPSWTSPRSRGSPARRPRRDDPRDRGRVHDLTLSADGPREAYLASMLTWLDDQLGHRGRASAPTR